ncbi:type IV toxin-antitoxin system AbiEi family antitoxin domain-containing protein [Mycolicibacterium cosmeticum]|uniref:type IV toxin-antitoxin system AbiEi family antitoxin domain-containing protein n=1 Tax=Mycolicibacterium cosmeticum TaxID=258533 RepID=UPI003D1603D2
MPARIAQLLDERGGVVTAAELLAVMSRQQLDRRVRKGALVKVWHGVYAGAPPDLATRLAALDRFLGCEAVVCLGTAARLYGFDVENTSAIHVLDPGVRLRSKIGLTVHQRVGAPLKRIEGRLATAPAWTAVEVARTLHRPRALATLDAAMRLTGCSRGDLDRAVREQSGRRGIVAVRELVPLADPRAESAMESEARLVMSDHGVAPTELQYEIRDRRGELWRLDFAWPEFGLVAEYDSDSWHSRPSEIRKDKRKLAAVQEIGWTVIPIISDDVRRHPQLLADRISTHLEMARLAGRGVAAQQTHTRAFPA